LEHQHIMERIQSGDEAAFAELVHPHIEKAYRSAYGLVRSKEMAEEVVQNAMIEAYRNLREGKEISYFPTWFSRLVSHRAIDIIRKTNRWNETELEERYAGTISGAMEEVIMSETKSEIQSCIHSLKNGDYRNVLLLYYYQEHSVQEVADLLGFSLSTVKSQLRRARIALKETLIQNQVIGVDYH
jgi:RNA polymerase sigma-70 factor, ECF subfamily